MVSFNQLISAFNGITDLISIMDTDFRIIFVNRKLAEFLNIENSDKIIGSKCFQSIHNKKDICNDCPALQTLKTGEIATVEKVLNGDILKYWTYPVTTNGNNIENIVSYGRIITETKKIERELIQSQKLKGIGQLAAGVAHELNNPICSILGFAELIKESIEENNPINELIDDIIDSAKQSREIVTSLLEYTRQSVSAVNFHSIESVIGKTLSLIKHTLKIKEISIIREYEENLPLVKIDMHKTVQAFINIISNALDSMSEGGKILITTRLEGGDYVSVSFSDDGCGIPEEYIDQIFNPFFTTKEDRRRTGLGLSIAREIIEQQNGTIDVKSEVGKGTTLKFHFRSNFNAG